MLFKFPDPPLYPRNEVMSNFLNTSNLGLALCKQFKSGNDYQHVFITNKIIESSFVSNKTSEITSVFPLYVYRECEEELFKNKLVSKPNLNLEIVNKIASKIDANFLSNRLSEVMDDPAKYKRNFSPTNLLDYIYSILYSSKYRNTYVEFLKIDFPRIPYPKDKDTFWKLVALGEKLRQLHLMEDSSLKLITQYPEGGDNIVEQVVYKDGNVYINDEQYFANVPEVAWNFYIGGYQPAQKWLKDRKGQALQFEDIKYYQKIIATLQRTSEIMEEIDQIDFM